MLRYTLFATALCLIFRFSQAQDLPERYSENWPGWRGPGNAGVSPHGNPPIEWSETKNVKWKIEIPGQGHASPIVWEDKVFVLTAIKTDEEVEKPEPQESTVDRGPPTDKANTIHEFVVMAINRESGAVLWQKTVCREAPVDGIHRSGTWASNSPVTDGEHLYAYFGSRGLYCLDFEGNMIWERDFGQMEKKMDFGEGSSPALYKSRIAIVWDHEGESFLYVLNKSTGEDVFKIPREEATTWASPIIVHVNGKDQIITSGTTRFRSYDLVSGEMLWEGTGMTRNVIPHPIVHNEMLYLMSGFRGNALMAIDLRKAEGDIMGSEAIVWEYNQNTPYTPSAMLADGKLYFLRSNHGNLTCLDAVDGKVNYSLEKLEDTGTIYASIVGAQDRLYVTSESGNTYVIKQGPTFEILSRNKLDDGNFASPAIVGNELYIRGFKFLYCISE
jgi:outer membrane protein assembly factor BamB